MRKLLVLLLLAYASDLDGPAPDYKNDSATSIIQACGKPLQHKNKRLYGGHCGADTPVPLGSPLA